MISSTVSNETILDEHLITSLARLMDDRILKHDDTFGVFDQHGNINLTFNEQGVFHHDTRYLSKLAVRLNGETPILLGSAVRDDNAMLSVNMANRGVEAGETEGEGIRFGTLHIERSIYICGDCCYDSIRIRNYGSDAVNATLSIDFGADFRDIFEVRGELRSKRGEMHEPEVERGRVRLSYTGLDHLKRTTQLMWSPAPEELSGARAVYHLDIPGGQEISLRCTIAMQQGDEYPECIVHEDALALIIRECNLIQDRASRIITSNVEFNAWIYHSYADLNMLTTHMGNGHYYPYAGVPWYSTVFGRDGLIAALQTLWCDPELARGVLRFLAAHQAEDYDPSRDAEPGKIVHEMRRCEMAATGEVPFCEYYGSVDATPLFVMLAGVYYRTTADRETIEEIWPNILRALHWMEHDGDHNGDGFLDYKRQSEGGLVNQGWKDSFDSIMHADGELVQGPVSLVEVQGYAYAARRGAAMLARVLGHDDIARDLDARADRLRRRFDQMFWCEQIQQYALALDGHNRRCTVRSSNPGQCLITGIVPPHRARAVAETLMADDMFSGWGVRTLSTTSARYNPTSYHNGSVWPHDNSIIAAGLARYGFTEYALRIMTSLFHVSTWMQRHRLPELFSGFERQDKVGPVGYPVACSPQAWASGGVFLMLRAALGMSIDAPNRAVRLTRPTLPESIDEMWIEGMRIGDAMLDLALTRRNDTVDVAVLRQEGDVQVIVSR